MILRSPFTGSRSEDMQGSPATEPQPDLFTPPSATAGTPSVEASWLERLLLEGKCWMTARDIMLTSTGSVLDRDIRQIASESTKIISGQKGYKHIAHASMEEIDHASNWLISQGKKMIKRGIATRRYAHQILG